MKKYRTTPSFPVSKKTGKHLMPTNIFTTEPKFVFVHIPKTAGSSIQKWLHLSRFPDIKFPTDWDGKVLWNFHTTAKEYKQKLGATYNNYYKFAFVRNPWDRMYSIYAFLQTYPNNKSIPSTFEKFVLTYDAQSRKPGQLGLQTDFILDSKGNCIVDFVGKFENLYNDLQIVSKHVSIDLPQTMYQENTTKHKHYREYYSTKAKETVGIKFKSDIDYFGYEF